MTVPDEAVQSNPNEQRILMSAEISDKQLAWFDYRKDYGSWSEPELSQVHKHFCAGYDAALKDAA